VRKIQVFVTDVPDTFTGAPGRTCLNAAFTTDPMPGWRSAQGDVRLWRITRGSSGPRACTRLGVRGIGKDKRLAI
jgi:hypothetical protein